MRAAGSAQRAAIYVSASNWAPLTRPAIPLSEQSRRCRDAIAADPSLKREATYRNRYENGEAGDFWRLIDDAINRRFDCLVICGGNRFGATERAAFFHIGRFLVPAGFRVIDVAEGWDTAKDGGKKYAFHLRVMSRMEKNEERRASDGAQEQED